MSIGKKDRLPIGVPNCLMASNNRTAKISANLLPSAVDEAVSDYYWNGGRLTDPHTFGLDAMHNQSLRQDRNTRGCTF